MKEKPSSTQQNKSSSEGSGRHCVMSREMERHIKDMHAKAGATATPSLRNIRVEYYF